MLVTITYHYNNNTRINTKLQNQFSKSKININLIGCVMIKYSSHTMTMILSIAC